ILRPDGKDDASDHWTGTPAKAGPKDILSYLGNDRHMAERVVNGGGDTVPGMCREPPMPGPIMCREPPMQETSMWDDFLGPGMIEEVPEPSFGSTIASAASAFFGLF